MKYTYILFLLFFSSFIFSQTTGISYQAVIIDPNGSGNTPLVNQNICLRFKIINSSTLIDYQENITASTDDFGIVNTIIGSGIPSGGSASTFNDIVWDKTSKSLIVEVDFNGTCSSFIEISNGPFTSIPYAFYATNGGTTNLSFIASPDNGVVVSNTGDNAIIPLASEATSGLLAPNGFSQLLNLTASLAEKQSVLVDSLNIKTINGNSILGNGDLVVDGKVSQTITNEVTTFAPSEAAVFQALDLKLNKNIVQIAETTPVNFFKINPFTEGNEIFGMDFNSYPNLDAGAGTYNHGAWMGYNVGHHSTNPITADKPSIMIGLEDNYYDHIGDLKFGTEFYVQGFSPDSSTIQFSRPYYARGSQKNDGTNWWAIISDIGTSGTDRSFTVRTGGTSLFQITPNSVDFYAAETRVNNTLKLQNGNFLIDNNRYIQIKNNLGLPSSVMTVHADNSLFIGDIFGDLGGSLNLRSGGVSSLQLNPSGNASFYGSATATSFIKSEGTSAQFLKADGSVDLNIYQPILSNPITGNLATGYLPKAIGTTSIGNSAINENGFLVTLNYPATAIIDTRLSIKNSGNGGSGRGTAIVMNVPGSANSVNGVKINAYTTGGATANQSVDLAFDLASSGTLDEKMRVKSNGNILIGTKVDNGVDKLQINGSASGSPATLSNQFVVKSQLDTKQNILTNLVIGMGTINTITKFTGSSTIGNSIINDNGTMVNISAGGGRTIDTRLSVSSSGNGGAGRGTAILMNVPGSANSVNGVKINAYTTGGPTANQSVDLAFDIASSGTLDEKMRVKSNGNILIGVTTDDTINKLQVAGKVVASQYKLSALNIAPASASALGTVGEIRYDADYMYVCVATNTWKRSPLTTW